EDVGADLAQQLLQLRQFREAAKELKKLDGRRRQSFSREPFADEQVIFFPDPALDIAALHAAGQKLAQEIAKIAKLPEASIAEVVSISEKIEHLQNQISEKVQFALSDL